MYISNKLEKSQSASPRPFCQKIELDSLGPMPCSTMWYNVKKLSDNMASFSISRISHNDITYTNPTDIANIMADHLAEVFSGKTYDPPFLIRKLEKLLSFSSGANPYITLISLPSKCRSRLKTTLKAPLQVSTKFIH